MTSILSSLQVKRESLREVHELAQSHAAAEWQVRNEIQPDYARLQSKSLWLKKYTGLWGRNQNTLKRQQKDRREEVEGDTPGFQEIAQTKYRITPIVVVPFSTGPFSPQCRREGESSVWAKEGSSCTSRKTEKNCFQLSE